MGIDYCFSLIRVFLRQETQAFVELLVVLYFFVGIFNHVLNFLKHFIYAYTANLPFSAAFEGADFSEYTSVNIFFNFR